MVASRMLETDLLDNGPLQAYSDYHILESSIV